MLSRSALRPALRVAFAASVSSASSAAKVPSFYTATTRTIASAIPKTQRALVVEKTGKDFQVSLDPKYPVPVPGPTEVLVKLTHSGVCHSDLSIIQDHWSTVKLGCKVCGHEGVGNVVSHGKDVDVAMYPKGLKVGVPLTKSVCNKCESCLHPGAEVYCDSADYFSVSTDGSWQEYVTVDTNYLVTVPDNLPNKYAGPLLCGGVTAYKGIQKAGLQPGNFITILGSGGGLGSMALFFARNAGYKVIAVDVGEEKRASSMKMGAHYFIDSSKTPDFGKEVFKITKRGSHGVVVFPPVRDVYSKALTCLGKHSTMVCVGIPGVEEFIDFTPTQAIWMDIKIVGSLVGTRKDLNDSLRIAADHGLEFPVSEHPMEACQDLLHAMDQGKLVGRAVLKF